LFKKILLNTIAQVFSKAITAIISIVLLSVLTNYLSQNLYWLYSKVYNYLWIFAFLADLWLYTITIREINKNKEESWKIVSNVMTLRTILWIIIIFLSVSIAFILPWYNDKVAIISILITAVFTLVSLINSSVLALMQANLKMEFSLISIILWKVATLLWILATIFIFYKKSNLTDYSIPFYYIMLSWLIWIVINTLMNYIYAKKITNFWFSCDWKYIKHIFKLSLPYWIALFLSVVYFKIDVILISLIEPKEKANLSIALYSLPMKIIEVLMVIWWFYLNSILWELSKNFKNNNYSQINNIFSISFKILSSFWLFLFVTLTLFRNHIVELVANKSYINPIWHIYSSSDVFFIVLLVLIFYFISNLFIYILIASNNESKLLKINIVVAIFNIIFNIIFIPYFSFIWSWITTVLSQILLFMIWYIEVNKITKINIPIKFTLINILISGLIYWLWNYLLTNYSKGLFVDIILYWSIISIIYLIYFIFIYKLNFNNKLKQL